MIRTQRLAVAVGTAAIVLSGCGGGSKSLSKGDLVSKANAICKQGNAELTKVPRPKVNTPTLTAAYFTKILAVGKREDAKLSALKPPKELKSGYDEFLAGNATAESYVGQIIAAAKARDSAKAKQLFAAIAKKTKAYNAKATKLGLTTCAM